MNQLVPVVAELRIDFDPKAARRQFVPKKGEGPPPQDEADHVEAALTALRNADLFKAFSARMPDKDSYVSVRRNGLGDYVVWVGRPSWKTSPFCFRFPAQDMGNPARREIFKKRILSLLRNFIIVKGDPNVVRVPTSKGFFHLIVNPNPPARGR